MNFQRDPRVAPPEGARELDNEPTVKRARRGFDTANLSSGALDRVYPMRSMINIESIVASPSLERPELFAPDGPVVAVSELGSGWGRKKGKEPTMEEPAEPPYITSRFAYSKTNDGHMIVTGIQGAEKLERCEVRRAIGAFLE